MREYELGVVINPELSEGEIATTFKNFEELITKMDGEVIKLDEWGRRNLAYTIRGKAEGYYGFIHLKANSELLAVLKKELKINPNILRGMLVKK